MPIKNIISNTRHKLDIKSHILSNIKSQTSQYAVLSIIIQYKIFTAYTKIISHFLISYDF